MRHVPRPGKIRFSLVLQSWGLLTVRERASLCLITASFVLASTIEMLALASAIPFVGLVMEPELTSENSLFARWASLLGDPPHRQLTIATGLITCGLIVSSFLGRMLVNLAIEWFAARSATRFASGLMATCLEAPYSWFLQQNASALGPRIYADATDVGVAIYPSLMEIVYATFIVIVGVTLILAASPQQSIFIMGAILLVCAVMLAVFRPMITRSAGHMRRGIVASNRTAIEIFESVKDIKIKSQEAAFGRAYRNVFASMARYRLRTKFIQKAVPLVILSTGQLGLVLLAIALFTTDMSRGAMAAQLTLLVIVLSRVLPATTRVVGIINKLSATMPHLQGLLDLQQELRGAAPQHDGKGSRAVPASWSELSLSSVGFHYEGSSKQAICPVSLSLRHGLAYGIVGPSGAGKSTLVDIILGLLEPTSGSIHVDDLPLHEYDRKSWFRQIGYVPQAPYFADDTLRRNIAFGIPDHQIDEGRVWTTVQAAGLREVCDGLDRGLDTTLGDRGLRLSGGQRQRVAIARALYHDPRLVVLDEATSSLDTLSARAVVETLHRMRGTVTTVSVTHNLSSLAHCDEIFVLDNGELVASGRYSELLGRHELFGKLVGNPESPNHLELTG